MKTTNPILSFILAIFFLKEYNYKEEEKRKMKKKSLFFAFFWLLFLFIFKFGLPKVLRNIPENTVLQVSLLFLIAFSIYQWFLMIYLSKFAPEHIAYFILLILISVVLLWNLVLWNRPAYNGAMDGFANLMTAQMQILIITILPTFLFSLRMSKFKNLLKGLYLLLLALCAGIFGVEQCIGKEGYLSDRTGQVFVFLILLLLAISAYLITISSTIKINKSTR